MADNVAITAGSGTTIATDDIGGVQYQRVKVALGADGAAADLAPGQALMAASVPVAIASNQSAVPASDAGPSWTSAYLHVASANATGGVDLTAAPTSGQKIVVDDVIVSVDTAMKVTLEEETSGTDVIVLYLPVNGSAQVTPRGRIKLPTADKKLRLLTSIAGNIDVTVCYHSEA
jgi:hypothetical protein